ncbi:MAG: family 10 glycosylhydrolase [Paludibacter sp.]|nr:family 10 glycosylhydrolase [Paludibacter sp.]
MKRVFQIVVLLMMCGVYLMAQSPKREVRATWLTTVWRLDWPSTTVPAATGTNEASRETARNVQKSGLIIILNKLQSANFNTVFFQVRGMSDAFYHSQYEPWSQDLSSSRGADPGWDPLAYIIEEAHARGIEVHAWVNPYRYSSAEGSHGNLPTDYAVAHPDWLLDYGNYTKILNPGMPEVRQQISNIVGDIVTNYDVDGIVFDDYFYVNGTTEAMDNAQYQAYNPNSLPRDDWRRENVNKMVKDVQQKINSIKPYVTFGISPAGVAASSAAVAAKYGVAPAPVGSDWQYSGISSDPLAWLKEGSIDYISPQVYWTIGSTNDFSKLSPWWSKVANHFGRHYYSSNTSSFSATELTNQVNINRDADLNGTTGSVYFRTNTLSTATMTAMKNSVNTSPALRAAYGWKLSPMQNLVDNLALSGQKLTWNYANNIVRYSIYAVPNANRNDADAFTSAKYLLGISYTKEYTLPATYNPSTHKMAVAVYDRYGNEFSPRVLGESVSTLAAPTLTYPANQADGIVLPTLFTWQHSVGASYYVWELSNNADFSLPIASRETSIPEFNSGLQSNMKENTTYYWRVKSLKANAPVAVSEVRSFSGTKFKMTLPIDATTNVSMTPTFTWTNIGIGANYTLELSDKPDFSVLAYTTNTQNVTTNVPSGVLVSSTIYYARVKANLVGIQAISERIYFITVELPVPTPILISPANGANIDGNEIEISWQIQNSKGFQAELSQDAIFPTRKTTRKLVDAFTYSAVYNNLDAGTYYLQVKALNSVGLTEPSNVVTVNLTGFTAIEELNASAFCYNYYDVDGKNHIVINDATTNIATVYIYSATGLLVSTKTYSLDAGKNILSPNMINYQQGLYLIRIKVGNNEKTIKVKR